MGEDTGIRGRFELLGWALDERMSRLWAAAEASTMGHGGVTRVAMATGISRRAIHAGLKELTAKSVPTSQNHVRVRRLGGGRKSILEHDPQLKESLRKLVEPDSLGDPESPLRWTCKSIRTLARELTAHGHPVGRTRVGELLHELDFSLQANRKTLEGSEHPDRDRQFQYLNEQVRAVISHGDPVISVDAKKKELVGQFKNIGRTWRPKERPVEVKVYDFIDEGGRDTPYGVYDIQTDTGWVNVGTDHDTASFAVESIRRWWRVMGRATYPQASQLMITADGGGSNGSRVRLWKFELQRFADEIGIPIRVGHLPPGTSKWNKIEHRLFSYISMNWRGKPLVSHEVIVSLIANTRNQTGLTVRADLDQNSYPLGIKVTKAQMDCVRIDRDDFHGEWNYTIRPAPSE